MAALRGEGGRCCQRLVARWRSKSLTNNKRHRWLVTVPPHASCATVPRAVLCASFLRCCVLPVLLSDGVGGVGSDFGNELRDPQLICAFLCRRDVRVVMPAVTTYRWAMTSFRGT